MRRKWNPREWERQARVETKDRNRNPLRAMQREPRFGNTK